jgi:hypothetical protein
MIRRILTLAAVILGLFAWAQPALAATGLKRVALVLGNSAYQSVAKLPNPARDAAAIAKLLQDSGFEVIQQNDVGNLEFKRAIRRFGDALVNADMAVVFYAGHGIEVRGVNYLIPIDAKLASDRDAEDEAVSLDRLVQEIEEAGGRPKQLRLIILDACRDNPFVKSMRVARAGPSRSRSAGGVGGLGAIQPTGSDMLIAYAAKQGSTAEDGDGHHSPFTQALLRSLTVPGLDIRLAFGRVRDDVLKLTRNQQEPFVYGSLGGGVISIVPAPQTQIAADGGAAKADYDRVAKIGTKKAFEVFIGTYKTGFYADLARAQIEELGKLDKIQLASHGPVSVSPPSTRPNTEETRAWSKVEGSNDVTALQKFIERYPNSPLAITAQDRINVLQRHARERAEEQLRTKQTAEIERQQAQREAALREKLEDIDRLKAEREAAAQRIEAERRAKAAAEVERQRLEQEAARQREEDARRAAAAKSAAERLALEAAAKRAEDERRAKAAEAERQRLAREAALKREEAAQRAKQAELSLQLQRAEEERKAWVEAERKKAAQLAALKPSQEEPKSAAQPAANTPELVTAAQKQLARVGCFEGKADGDWNELTKSALRRYHLQKGQIAKDVSVTEGLLSELDGEKSRVCPLVCRDGYESNGEACIAKAKPKKPEQTVTKKHKPEKKEKQQAKSKSKPQPQARREASSAPRASGGGSISGVGF